MLGDRVRYRTGALVAEGVQALPPASLTNPATGGPGVRVRYLDADGGELALEDRRWVELAWLGSGLPAGTSSVELRTCWAPRPGRYRLGVRAPGALHLMVDGETLLDTVTTSEEGRFVAAFADPPSAAVEVTVQGTVELVLRQTLPPEPPIRAVTLGVVPVVDDPDAEIAAAAALARECAVALVVVGTNEQVESEGFDRDTLALPGRQGCRWPARWSTPRACTSATAAGCARARRRPSRSGTAWATRRESCGSARATPAEGGATVQVELANTGDRPGRAVVQRTGPDPPGGRSSRGSSRCTSARRWPTRR